MIEIAQCRLADVERVRRYGKLESSAACESWDYVFPRSRGIIFVSRL